MVTDKLHEFYGISWGYVFPPLKLNAPDRIYISAQMIVRRRIEGGGGGHAHSSKPYPRVLQNILSSFVSTVEPVLLFNS